MSGTLFVRDKVTWMPSAATVSWILEELAAEVRNIDEGLSTALLDPAKGHDWGKYDFKSFERKQFQLLLEGVTNIYEREASKGNNVTATSGCFLIYMQSLSTFKALLRTDPRSNQDVSSVCRIDVSKNLHWTAQTWIYDFILENLSAFAITLDFPSSKSMSPYFTDDVYNAITSAKDYEDTVLAQQLLAARTLNNCNYCNLIKLELERYFILLAAAKFMKVNYPSTRGLSNAPDEMEKLIPRIDELSSIFRFGYW